MIICVNLKETKLWGMVVFKITHESYALTDYCLYAQHDAMSVYHCPVKLSENEMTGKTYCTEKKNVNCNTASSI